MAGGFITAFMEAGVVAPIVGKPQERGSAPMPRLSCGDKTESGQQG